MLLNCIVKGCIVYLKQKQTIIIAITITINAEATPIPTISAKVVPAQWSWMEENFFRASHKIMISHFAASACFQHPYPKTSSYATVLELNSPPQTTCIAKLFTVMYLEQKQAIIAVTIMITAKTPIEGPTISATVVPAWPWMEEEICIVQCPTSVYIIWQPIQA